MLRPLRDQMAIAGGVEALPWLFTRDLRHPARRAAAVRRAGGAAAAAPLHRRSSITSSPSISRAFWLLLVLGIEPVAVARVFFVWVSVFNLFAVAVFWSFMADLFDSEQGKRLFGFIGAGGTAGALLGPVLTIALAGPLGPANLLLVALVLLEVAVLCVHRLERAARRRGKRPRRDERAIGGSAFAALPEIAALALPARRRARG